MEDGVYSGGKLIPKVKAYIDTPVSSNRTRFETEEMLEKKFNIKTTIWKKEDPQNTWFGFQYTPKDATEPITYKIQVPFIEKERREQKGNRYSKKIVEYDEKRSYRFFFHILKAMMLNTEIGMNFEQIMANYMVVGQLGDGTPINVLDKVNEMIVDPNRKTLQLL